MLWWTLRKLRSGDKRAFAKAVRSRNVDALLILLRDDDNHYLRRQVINALGAIGDTRALQALTQSLTDWYVTEAAAEALRRIGDPRAVEPLVAALVQLWRPCAGEEAIVKRLYAREAYGSIVSALDVIRDRGWVDLLIPILRDSDPRVRVAAAATLRKVSDPRVVEALLGVVRQDADPFVRREVVVILEQVSDPLVVEALGDVVRRDAELGVRVSAAEILGRFRDSRSVDALIQVLDGSNNLLRAAAAEALGRIGDARAASALGRLLEEQDEGIWPMAATALDHIGAGPANNTQRLAYAAVRRKWSEFLKLGPVAIGPLIAMIAKSGTKSDMERAINTLEQLLKMHAPTISDADLGKLTVLRDAKGSTERTERYVDDNGYDTSGREFVDERDMKERSVLDWSIVSSDSVRQLARNELARRGKGA